MCASLNEKISSQERQAIWVELQSLRQDTQAFRTEVYRLRTTGSLDAATNERLRARQTELECRGEVIIKRCVHFSYRFFWPSLRKHRLSPQLEWRTEQTSGIQQSLPPIMDISNITTSQVGGDVMEISQFQLPASQMSLTSTNSLQLQASNYKYSTFQALTSEL
jgi:hypothetical protein